MFSDFRWVWARGSDGMPHFGIIGIHNNEALFEVTGMNPYGEQLTPIMLYLAKNTTHYDVLLQIIGDHLLKSKGIF